MNLKFWQKPKDDKKKPKKKKSKTREWIDAIVFAVIAATLIRGLVVEAYTIPSSSMEKSLLKGDYLFVNKLAYGPRLAITPLSFPFVHNTLPIINTKSYLEWIKLPYYRLPGYTHVKNNDVVVFNYPLDSTRPVDEQENYIKRCIAIPGDTVEIRDEQVYVNGKPAWNPPDMQHEYFVKTNGLPWDTQALKDMHINLDETGRQLDQPLMYSFTLTAATVEKMKALKNVVGVTRYSQPKGATPPLELDPIFPYDQTNFPFNVDNYGPIVIPKKGVTVQITPQNIALYKRIIRVYEGNADVDDIGVKGGKVYLNGKEITQYTFKMNYYWMMGDNRHDSEDSRYWGFVPEDHIVGKAWLIWMSWDSYADFPKEIRFNRMFHFIR